jgi:hypothetical protein
MTTLDFLNSYSTSIIDQSIWDDEIYKNDYDSIKEQVKYEYNDFGINGLFTTVECEYELDYDYNNYTKIKKIDNLELDPNNPKHDALFKVISEYPFLSDHMVLFKMPPNVCTEIHLDGLADATRRIYSCNIPIQGCTPECITEFYQTNLDDFEDQLEHILRFIPPNRPTVKVAEYSLVYNPVLVNTQTAHRVNNTSKTEVRTSVSWSIRTDWTIEQIAKTVDLGVIV